MNILCIAPYAPPLCHAEPIQVGRYVGELLKTNHVRLVAERPTGSWSTLDPALALRGPALSQLELALPHHGLATRVIGNRYLAPLAQLLERWPLLFSKRVLQWAAPFDIIYSRSMPFRGALLGARIKRLSGKPWIMHLSDPWADSAYTTASHHNVAAMHRDERECFARADLITLTTEPMADFYRQKYPEASSRIRVSPNVCPTGARRRLLRPRKRDMLRLVYTGALYGDRNLLPLVSAIRKLSGDRQARLRLIIAGNASEETMRAINEVAQGALEYLGPLSAEEANQLQRDADIAIVFEPSAQHPLSGVHLPSKVLDYLVAGPPILAITPAGSVTSRLVNRKYGWARDPLDVSGIAALLDSLLDDFASDEELRFSVDLPDELRAETAVRHLQAWMEHLVRVP